MAEYSLEITLKDKSQTRLDPNSMVKFRVMPEFTRVLSTLFSICRYVLIFIKSYIYFGNGHISTVRQFTSDASGFCMSVESMYILHMYVSVVFLEADNNFYYNEASARYQSSGKHFDAKKNLVNQRALHITKKGITIYGPRHRRGHGRRHWLHLLRRLLCSRRRRSDLEFSIWRGHCYTK